MVKSKNKDTKKPEPLDEEIERVISLLIALRLKEEEFARRGDLEDETGGNQVKQAPDYYT